MTEQQQQHPITPPLELKQQWEEDWWLDLEIKDREIWLYMADRGAQWGYDQRGEVNESKLQQARDQELEACCALMDDWGLDGDDLRAARRPKPPSLKKQALKALDEALFMADDNPPEGICSDQADTIRRALEALPDE